MSFGFSITFELYELQLLLKGLNTEDSTLVSTTLECIFNCCVRHEHNRQNFMRNNLLMHVDKALTKNEKENAIRVARIWQALVQDDDIRVPFRSSCNSWN